MLGLYYETLTLMEANLVAGLQKKGIMSSKDLDVTNKAWYLYIGTMVIRVANRRLWGLLVMVMKYHQI